MKMMRVICVVLSLIVLEVSGHGMMLDPPGRSSLWRFHEAAPVNYNDNKNFCGGIVVLWQQNGGKCGVCGDAYQIPHPQPNENTGIFGQGHIAAEYKAGQVIETSVLLTANHLGYFEYHLCELEDASSYESGEDCFQLLTYEDGSTKFAISADSYEVVNRLRLPDGVTCERCVLRWQYHAANNWGMCDDGSNRPGCGPQEVFRSCADITIV